MPLDKHNLNILQKNYKFVPDGVLKEILIEANRNVFRAEVAIEEYAKTKNIPIRKKNGPIRANLRLVSVDYSQKKKAYREDIDRLHLLRRQNPNWREEAYEPLTYAINSRVIWWNEENPVAPGYYDLHGMTPQTAASYVEYLIKEIPMNELKFETGVGKHSTHQYSLVRRSVEERLKELQNNDELRKNLGIKDFSMTYEKGNEGITIVKF